ncbi:ABC transporter ATP-binding protein [Sedimentibacter sp. zth1]|uniref:ABC transporter ATP-binding protein n=1 Tax=Sedimentibacter sp. zth1 TaxID=2816908 RepID=UPI001A915239|nr:ABC transporter ATP-binding protein [Sedimentibacter sp. zth1]QSX05409.1 ABC transporter ATP-binding protein [Sedimentibacter sp. zth1]
MESYIRFENVTKCFKQETVINDVSFEIEKGKIYGFVGRNGSGKTVIFKLIAGLLLPTKGNIYYNGKNITTSKNFIESLGALIEIPGFIPHYSGMKNLSILNGLSKKRVSKTEIEDYMELMGLNPKNKKPVRTYSLGMKQKLGIVQAIMNNPDLLILDEPMNGLDESSVERMRNFFVELRDKKNTTIILASHNKEDIEILCDKLFHVVDGSLREECASL